MEDISAELRDRISPFLDKPGPRKWTLRPIETTTIWNFCQTVEDPNPVYWDEEYAATTRFGRLIAPPHAAWAFTMDQWWLPPTLRARATEADLARANSPQSRARAVLKEYGFETLTVVSREEQYLSPYGPGDGRLGQEDRVVSVSDVKRTKVGEGVFFTYDIDFFTDASGDDPVARARNVTLIYKPEGAPA